MVLEEAHVVVLPYDTSVSGYPGGPINFLSVPKFRFRTTSLKLSVPCPQIQVTSSKVLVSTIFFILYSWTGWP